MAMLPVFLCSKVFLVKKITTDSKPPLVFPQNNQLLGLRNQLVSTVSCLIQSSEVYPEIAVSESILEPISSENSSKNNSFTVSYLINSCGLSPETAISVSEKVKFETPERPDAVLTLLKKHGFNKTQISILVRKRPSLLLSRSEKTLSPKLEFFESIGISTPDVARMLSRDPDPLVRSLENRIIPCYNFLKSVFLSDEKVAMATKSNTWIFREDHSKNLAPNIDALMELGVPRSKMLLFLIQHPWSIMQRHDLFRETIVEVKKLGFDPLKTTFVSAIHALSIKSNKSQWDRCYDTYRKWGWSKDEILLAFRKHPDCMILSEKKINTAMDFLLNKMGWLSSDIVSCPQVIFYSLEKRIIPRCSVVKFLYSKGLITKGVKLSSVLIPAEKHFLERFVTKYVEEVPELLEVYQGKLDVSGIII